MKKFSVLRYLKQFSLLILLLSVVGALAIYRYGKSQQRYTASAVIQYTNAGANNGYTPDGSVLNVEEIYSSTVVDAALKDLGYETNIDSIRSNCYVEEMIPETKQKLIDVLLDKGEEVSYTPNTYKIYYVAGSETSENYAWNVLDAIIKNYCEYYTEKYVEQRLQNNGANALEKDEYDYIESAQILEDSVSQMLDYLNQKGTSFPYYRSVNTGYTYNDLVNIYTYMYNYEIPSLYATILDNAETSNIEVLVNRLKKECEDLELTISNQEKQANQLKSLMFNYSDRNKEMMDYHYHNASNQESGTDYILKLVEDDRNEEGSKETTYDSLTQEYVNLRISIRNNEIEKMHNQYMQSVFAEAMNTESRKTYTEQEILDKIDHCLNLVNTYYVNVEQTGRELNRYLSADYLKMVSSITVSEAVNIKLYIVIAVVLFAFVGVVGAVLLGRLIDFIDYFLYVDKTVGIPNRARCDVFIEENAQKLLPENYSCLALRMTSLNDISKNFGRATGDQVLKDFALILKSFGELYGFVGYNGSGSFMMFFPECSAAKLDVVIEAIKRQVDEYNKLNEGREIQYSCGKSETDLDNTFDIRGLLRLSLQRMNSAAKPA